jgi:hypothetical protein
MSDWLTYKPEDFLLFSSRVYFRLLELHNEALWPAQLVMLALGVALFIIVLRGGATELRLAGLLLGVLWMWVAYSFLWERYAAINWAIAYIAPIFVAQGIALTLSPVRANNPFPTQGAARWCGLALLAGAILLYPLVAPALGRPWSAAEVFGLMPDPTAFATLGYLAIARRSGWLMTVPVLWCALSSETLWLLRAPDFFIPIAGALAALAVRLAAIPPRTLR